MNFKLAVYIAHRMWDKNPPVGSTCEALVGGLGMVPQKVKQFADIVYRF